MSFARQVISPSSSFVPRLSTALVIATFSPYFRLARLGVALHAANRDHWLSIIHVADLADAIVTLCDRHRGAGARLLPWQRRARAVGRALPSRRARCANRELNVDIEIPSFLIDAGAADWRRRRASDRGVLDCSPRRR